MTLQEEYHSSLCSQKFSGCTLTPCLSHTGPDIWLEYAQYSIGGMGAAGGIDRVRTIFERALTAVGLHMTKGAALWEAFREFEIAILSTLQVSKMCCFLFIVEVRKVATIQCKFLSAKKVLDRKVPVYSGGGIGNCAKILLSAMRD